MPVYPTRNGDALIQTMLSQLHGIDYLVTDFTIDSIAPSTVGGRNTAITMSFHTGPLADQSATYYYHRLHMAVLIGARQLQLPDGGQYLTTRDFVAPINAELGLNLTAGDLIDEPVVSGTYPYEITLRASPTSRVLHGSCTITLVSADQNVGSLPFLFGLHTLTNSKEESFHLYGFDAISGVTGEVNGYNGSASNHDFTYGSMGALPMNGTRVYLGSSKYIDDTNRPSYVAAFEISPTGASKVTGELNLSDGATGSDPVVAVGPDGRGYVAEVVRGSATGAFTLKAVEVVNDAVVQVGNAFQGTLGDVGMSYQTQGFREAAFIDGHLIVAYRLEGEASGNLHFDAYAFNGTDFSFVRTWSPMHRMPYRPHFVGNRIVCNGPTETEMFVYEYTASGGAVEVLREDLAAELIAGIYLEANQAGFDAATNTLWFTAYDETYENSALCPYAVDFQAGTLTALPRIEGLGGGLTAPDLIYSNYLFSSNADWSADVVRHYDGTTATTVGGDLQLPPGIRFAVPLPQ